MECKRRKYMQKIYETILKSTLSIYKKCVMCVTYTFDKVQALNAFRIKFLRLYKLIMSMHTNDVNWEVYYQHNCTHCTYTTRRVDVKILYSLCKKECDVNKMFRIKGALRMRVGWRVNLAAFNLSTFSYLAFSLMIKEI